MESLLRNVAASLVISRKLSSYAKAVKKSLQSFNMKINYRPQHEFPRFEEACKHFAIGDGICFTYGDVYYTNHAPIPSDFLIHEQTHTAQQAKIGAKEWWDRYFIDPRFRMEQEIECFNKQLASIKDRNLRFQRRRAAIEELSSPMYGACATKEELNTLLK